MCFVFLHDQDISNFQPETRSVRPLFIFYYNFDLLYEFTNDFNGEFNHLHPPQFFILNIEIHGNLIKDF